MSKILITVGLSVLAILTTNTFAAPVSRDWAKNPAIVVLDQAPNRIFAVGDMHGDYQRMLTLLVNSHIVTPKPKRPNAAHWIAGKSVLVVTGDMIDKGPHPVNVIRFLAALRKSAEAEGGRVVVTMGNHEAEFLAGPNDVKAKDFLRDLKRSHIDEAAVLRCEGDIGTFLCSLPFGVKAGDWFFSHAGNTAGRSLSQLEEALSTAVAGDGFAAKELSDPNSLLEARLGEGKVWFHPSSKNSATRLTERRLLAVNAEALGVSHMAQGHQPAEVTFEDGIVRRKGEMFQRWGLLFLIDTGMSRKVKESKGAILEITLDAAAHTKQVTAICPGGARTNLWDAATNPEVGRAAPCSR